MLVYVLDGKACYRAGTYPAGGIKVVTGGVLRGRLCINNPVKYVARKVHTGVCGAKKCYGNVIFAANLSRVNRCEGLDRFRLLLFNLFIALNGGCIRL